MRNSCTRWAVVFALTLAAHAAAKPPAADTPDARIRQALALTAYTVQNIDLPPQTGAPFTVHLTLAGQAVDVDLTPHSVRAPGFKVMVQDGDGTLHEIPAPPVNTYVGSIEQDPAGTAAGGLNAAGLSLVLITGQGPARQSWFIQPLADAIPGSPPNAHVVYREQDRVKLDARCGTDEPAAHLPRPDLRLPGTVPGGTDAPLVCEIACEADFEFYSLNGQNTTTTTNDINTVIAQVSQIYTNDVNVQFQITQVIIRTSAATNPYTTNDPSALLNQMTAYWQNNHANVPRDIAHLFTGRAINGSVIGIAWISGVCSFSIGYGLVESRFTTNMAYRVGLSAHELGHNFSAQHCDSVCNPCYIMCSGLGGCNGVVTTFEPCNRTVISNYAQTRPCLAPLPPPVLALPFTDDFPSITLDPLKWANNTGAGVNATPGAPSPPNALLFIQSVGVETKDLNTAAPNRPVFVSFRYHRTGVEAGKSLNVKCFNEFANAFEPMGSLVSDGIDTSRFIYKEFKLPITGLSNTKGRIRFESVGNQFDDAWYIDDVSVNIYCRADVNKDGSLNLADFGAFQTAFALGNMAVADFNDDGVLNLADFGAFQTAFALGCY
jgi:hypothetical protein